ncbi:SurA N-terminal domain-containing protein [Agaribacterium haliotis]|uniref:SurA N-terminal domain-containing protein n=1 Tax=Agaribacterium haliotis TaxID=2013869 RepID=UPI000BB532BD|nr:SurA N-terminal domain-containing protein [Agaribacterium haliotis]
MLESVRQNLKGTLAVVVILVFVVPMVLTGVGQGYLGSVAGNDAASVNGQAISNIDLQRAIRMQRDRMMRQGNIDASSPLLSEERLRDPVLNNLTTRMALVTNAEKSGMAISDRVYSSSITQAPEFQIDGAFSQSVFRNMLAQAGFTPSSYREEVSADMLINQQAAGLAASSFATELELLQLVKLTHQKRSFVAVEIPASKLEQSIEPSEQALLDYYEQNKESFRVAEKVQVEYLELSVDAIAATIDVAEEDIRQQYDAEVANFSGKDSYELAHILIEDGDAATVQEVQSKLDAGEEFAALAEQYSDDIATNMDGGALGVLSPGMFPEAFEQAAYQLEQGQVSGAVETEAGVHFIKALVVSKQEVPSFDARKMAISAEIAKVQAAEDYALQAESLSELTFSSDDLSAASAELALPVQLTSYFDRNSGSGIAELAEVRNEAFDPEVLTNGHNSKLLELGPERSVVLRIKEHKPSYIKTLDEVKALVAARVSEQLQSEQLAALAAELQASIEAGADAQQLSEEKGYVYNSYAAVKRDQADVNREVIATAFTSAVPESGQVTYVQHKLANGDMLLLALSSVEDGSEADMLEGERDAFFAQLGRAYANQDGGAFEAEVVALADIKLN